MGMCIDETILDYTVISAVIFLSAWDGCRS